MKKHTLTLIALTFILPAYAWAGLEVKIDNTEPQTAVESDRSPARIALDRSEEAEEAVAGKIGEVISINMAPRQVTLNPDQVKFLEAHVLRRLQENPDLRLGIQSLARENIEDRYEGARIAIARGLEIRQFLMDRKIVSKRLVSQPLGLPGQQADDDRIDLVFMK